MGDPRSWWSGSYAIYCLEDPGKLACALSLRSQEKVILIPQNHWEDPERRSTSWIWPNAKVTFKISPPPKKKPQNTKIGKLAHEGKE